MEGEIHAKFIDSYNLSQAMQVGVRLEPITGSHNSCTARARNKGLVPLLLDRAR